MKKFSFALVFILLNANLLFGENIDKMVKISTFIRFFDDRYFGFKANAIKEFGCIPKDINIISLRDAPHCISKKSTIKQFEKEHKKAIENIFHPGKNFFVTIYGWRDGGAVCDFSDDKANYQLLLVSHGYAIPKAGSHKSLFEAYEKAKNEKRGMFGTRFEKIGECILKK